MDNNSPSKLLVMKNVGSKSIVTALTRDGNQDVMEFHSSVSQCEPLERSPLSSRRIVAVEQADSVLEMIGGRSHLDGFNLLGVVANPLAGGANGSSTTTYSTSLSAAHGRYAASTQGPTVAPPEDSTTVASYFQSFEHTISQVTESIGVFNTVLEDWSRSILEDNPSELTMLNRSGLGVGNSTNSLINPLLAMLGAGTGQDDDDLIPESQLKELPAELSGDVDVSAIEVYLRESGFGVASFHQHLYEGNERSTSIIHNNTAAPTGTRLDRYDKPSEPTSVDLVDLSEIPDLFFDDNFDLTDPALFCDLLFTDKGTNILTSKWITNDGIENSTILTVSDLFPAVKPQRFDGYLNKVEAALIEQVRANSEQFLIESRRFAQLHEEIHTLLETVQNQSSLNDVLQYEMVKTAESIPTCDAQREQLRLLWDVLDLADSLLQCKAGLAGILSAQDDLTAIEQIHYGRRLLLSENSNKDASVESSSFHSSHQEIALARLNSLKSISVQLDQYEELVVNNLCDELVEIFLAWNENCVSVQSTTSYGGSGSNTIMNGSASYTPMLKENVRNRVREITSALQSCQALSKARLKYQNRLQDLIRMTVRTTVGEFASDTGVSTTKTSSGVSEMTLTRFLDCLDMLFEQLLGLLTSAVGVDTFYVNERLTLGEDSLSSKSFVHHEADKDSEHMEVKLNEDLLTEEPLTSTATTPLAAIVVAASELSSKSISELLRLRKEAHSLVSLEEMKALWDVCTDFARQVDNLSIGGSCGHIKPPTSGSIASFAHTSVLRSTLLTQAKSFVERKHESHMSALVAALDSERWVQCDVSFERQAALSRLCSGRAILVSLAANMTANSIGDGTSDFTTPLQQKSPEIEAEGVRYKVVWSCLLLVEMLLTNIATSAQFPSLATNSVNKTSELLRLFNSRTTHLVLGAGAIHSNARLKSINAKHLSLVTQCLGLVISILPHVRAALAAQMPKKQHSLLVGLDQIKKEYADHNEKILNKFVSIIGGIVEHGLAKQIYGISFDERAKAAKTTTDTTSGTSVTCCVFLDGISSNTRKMHQVLSTLLPPDHLKDVFSRIYAYIDSKVPAIFIAAAEASESQMSSKGPNKDTNGKSPQRSQQKQQIFLFPTSAEGKRQFLLEIECTTNILNGLEGIHPWEFTARNVLERRLEYFLDENPVFSNDTTSRTMEIEDASVVKSQENTVENSDESAIDKNVNKDDNGMKTEDLKDENTEENENHKVDNEMKNQDYKMENAITRKDVEKDNTTKKESIDSAIKGDEAHSVEGNADELCQAADQSEITPLSQPLDTTQDQYSSCHSNFDEQADRNSTNESNTDVGIVHGTKDVEVDIDYQEKTYSNHSPDTESDQIQ